MTQSWQPPPSLLAAAAAAALPLLPRGSSRGREGEEEGEGEGLQIQVAEVLLVLAALLQQAIHTQRQTIKQGLATRRLGG